MTIGSQMTKEDTNTEHFDVAGYNNQISFGMTVMVTGVDPGGAQGASASPIPLPSFLQCILKPFLTVAFAELNTCTEILAIQ